MERAYAAGGIDEVDPEIRRFQRRVTDDYARLAPPDSADMAERRAVAEAVRRPWTAGGPAMAETLNLQVGPLAVPIRIHRPACAEPGPVLVYLHGGGWVMFSLETHDRLMREYAARSGMTVVGVGYGLAPEHRFPRALEEVVSVLGWLRAQGAGLGLDGQRLAVGGDSAGANLALTASLALRDAGRPLPAAMLLNYGAYDTVPRPSHERYDGAGYMLTAEEMRGFWALYLGGAESPLATPLRARLEGLPPAFLCIAQCDILADENRELARRLVAAGVATTVRDYPGATHSFLEAVSISGLAQRALDEAAAWLAGSLAS